MNVKQLVKEMFSCIKSNWYLPVVEKQVYSEAEQVVGVWTDGKPLYRRIIDFGSRKKLATNSWSNIYDVSVYEIEALVRSDFKTGDNYNCMVEYVYVDGGMLKGFVNGNTTATVQSVILEYTKTTDTPTQSKVPFEPLVEYSLDEKLVGYFGEKSIYEITIAYSGNDGTVGTYDAVADISSFNVAYVLSAIAFNENASDNGCRVFDAIVQNNILKVKSSTSCIKSGDNVVVRYAKQ